ncbi:MAG: SGNH/GDSL hydrolase family protein [Jatrophihabitantaceae bacterium]
MRPAADALPGQGSVQVVVELVAAVVHERQPDVRRERVGDGAGHRRRREISLELLAGSLAIDVKNFGDSGAGYAKSGADHKRFADQVDAVGAAQPDVIVVSGGRNDVVDDLSTLTSAADDLFSELHRKLPSAILVAVAPFWGDSDQPPAIGSIAGSIKSAVESAGGQYLNLPDPLHGHPEFMADAADPNDAGYAAIAAALQPALAKLLPG